MRAVTQRRSNVVVVCSDKARTGKTLLARLVMDYLLLALRNPFVFDTSPSPGGIAQFYPERSMVVDLHRTAGQVALFDTILNSPPRDFVIDLDAPQFERFYSVMNDIGLIDELFQRNIALGILYIADPSGETTAVVDRALAGLSSDMVTVVTNLGLAPAVRGKAPDPVVPVALAGAATLVIPALDRDVAREVDRPPFSFAGVVEGWMRRFDDQRLLRLLKFLNVMVPAVRRIVDQLDHQAVGARPP